MKGFFVICLCFAVAISAYTPGDGAVDRKISLEMVEKVSYPVLEALSRDSFRKEFIQEKTPHRPDNTSTNAYAEGFARSLMGIAPWINLGPSETEEGKMRAQYLNLTVKAFKNFNDPKAKDYILLNGGGQKLVEAAFFALSLLQAPILWENFDNETRVNVESNLRRALHDSGKYKNNWVLFPACVEAALLKYTSYQGTTWIEEGVNLINGWYKGDGMYGDGSSFHMDYYNSLVMHPLLTACVELLKEKGHSMGSKYDCFMKRSARYAYILERFIMPDGSYPIVGRSEAYRIGVFHHLSDSVLRNNLLKRQSKPAVRSALTALISKFLENKDNFIDDKWLSVGVYGHQPHQGDGYINTGSTYFVTNVLKHLGLPENDTYWTEKGQYWDQAQLWQGIDIELDEAYDGGNC
ncbi:hypothetical protein WA158_001387 [Blastocystis sp. Blastoise]